MAMVLLVSLLAAEGSAAQDGIFLRITSNLPEAVVYADSARIGPASQGVVVVPSATQVLRLVPPSRDSWSIAPVTQPLKAAPGDTLSMTIDFPYYYRVESVPFDATVYEETAQGRALLGSTPLSYASDEPLRGTLVVEKDGYAPRRIAPGGEVWNRYSLALTPADDRLAQASEVAWKPPHRRRAWIDYAAVGTALAAGALAVHWKFKADRAFDRYQASTDTSLRPVVERYDTRSGIAFGVMQAGVAVFAVRLILR